MTGTESSIVATVEELCATAERITAGGPLAARVGEIDARLHGPLRVAIAGRLKAGKSTLLNALVGERLAATDAGECTKTITVFRHAAGYEVAAVLTDGTRRPLTFRRADGALAIDLGDLHADDVDHLDVGWPAKVLSDLTLIDTPGLESLNDEHSRRTRAFLEHDASSPADADAVVYLMRHLHRSDAEFLGAFMDRTVAGASPVNAIAVLSRADEIGACRADAMTSSARIAARYGADPGVRTLVAAVVPVAGLLAETGLTLRESEYQALAQLATMSADDRASLCRSVDDFCDTSLSPLTSEIRRDLLQRLGMFGVRAALDTIAAGHVTSAGDLSRSLTEVSGVASLHNLIRTQFLPRARLLKARTALVALRGVAAELTATGSPEAPAFAAAVDRADAGALEFAILQAVHLVLSGAVALGEAESVEVERALSDPDLTAALGLSELSPDDRRAAVLAGLTRWRERSNDPLSNPLVSSIADTMARLYERVFAAG